MSSSSTTTTTTEVIHDAAKRKHSDMDGVPNKRAKIISSDEGSDGGTCSPHNESKTKDQLLADQLAQIQSPRFGQIVNRRDFRRAGPYLIGQKLGHSPVDSIVQYLAKKENSNEFVQLKILMLSNNSRNEKLLQDERQGKMLLHTEFSLLSLLQYQTGVIQQHGMFSDMAYEEDQLNSLNNDIYYTGKVRKRLILVLDCVTAHDFDDKSTAFVNLQQYLINRKKLPEMEALKIFYEIVVVVENLHRHNVIHRDLKLGNIVLNVHSNRIKIINFCLGKYLLNENHLLNDQRGSPAYISPDVLCGQPYKGKPSDMWALGVVLFMMLYRQFPFFESTPTALFKKIKSADYTIPLNSEVSEESEQIIKGLLQLNPERRFTATQVRQRLEMVLKRNTYQSSDRTVPGYSGEPTTPPSKMPPLQMSNRKLLRARMVKRVCHQLDHIVPVIPDSVLEYSGQRRQKPNTDMASLVPSTPEITPPRLQVERVSQDARHVNLTDIGQLLRPTQMPSLSLRNLARSWQDVIRTRNNSNLSSNSSQVTQQMSNLTLRSRRETMRRSANDDTSRAAPNNIVNNNRLTTNSTDYSRFFNRLYRAAMLRSSQNRQQRIHDIRTAADLIQSIDAPTAASNATNSSQDTSVGAGGRSGLPRPSQNRQQRIHDIRTAAELLQSIETASATSNVVNSSRDTLVGIGSSDLDRAETAEGTALSGSRGQHRDIQSLFESFTEMYVRSRIVAPGSNLQEFTGIITDDLAHKLCEWLVREHRRHTLIQSIFVHSTGNAIDKVLQFLRQCGVQFQTINHVTKIKRHQSLNLIMVLSYLLHSAGYKNSYFY